MRRLRPSLALAFSAALAACSRDDAAHAAAPAASAPDLVLWNVPSPSWIRVDVPSPVRRATFRIPREVGETEDAECAVLAYPAETGGEMSAVLDRWVAEFSQADAIEVKRSERLPPLRGELVEVHGTWLPPALPGRDPQAAHPKWGLLGAAVETVAGVRFFRLTGPESAVIRARGYFKQLIDSVHVDVR